MKKSWLCGLAAVAGTLFAPLAHAADNPVAPFITPTTDLVIHVDTTQIDLDAVDAIFQKAMANAPQTNPAVAAHNLQDEKKNMAKAKKWVNDFQAAGGRDLYVVVDLSGLFMVGPGEVVVPMDAAASPDALGKVFPQAPPANPNGGQQSPMMPDSAVMGKVFVCTTSGMLQKLKSMPPPPAGQHSVLTDALDAGQKAGVCIALNPASIRNNPMLAMLMGPAMRAANPNGPPPPPPMSEPAWMNVSWMLISINSPPKESGSIVCQCTDAASADALAKFITQKMNETPKNPQGPQMDPADQEKLKAVFKPKVSGTQVVMGVDQNTFDTVVLPIMVKMSQRQPPPRQSSPGQSMPGQPGQPMPGGPDNGGNGAPNPGGM